MRLTHLIDNDVLGLKRLACSPVCEPVCNIRKVGRLVEAGKRIPQTVQLTAVDEQKARLRGAGIFLSNRMRTMTGLLRVGQDRSHVLDGQLVEFRNLLVRNVVIVILDDGIGSKPQCANCRHTTQFPGVPLHDGGTRTSQYRSS